MHEMYKNSNFNEIVLKNYILRRLESDLVLLLALLLGADFDLLGALECLLVLVLALRALEPENDLLGHLSLLVENGLGLTTKTLLLSVVTSLT